MVCLAERNAALPHQPVGQIGRGGVAEFGSGAHARGVESRAGDHSGHRRDREAHQAGGFEHRRLVVLHVLGIGQRQAFHRDHQAGEAADHAARMPAHQFGSIGVLLLRHDRRTGREAVRQADEAEGLARPEDQFLGKTREVQRSRRAGPQEVEGKVAVGYGVQ